MINFIYRNKQYRIIECTLEDIPSHLGRVYPYVESDMVEVQVKRMIKAVQNNNAHKLVDENNETKVFFYYTPEDKQNVHAIALWYNSLRLFVVSLVWFRHYTNTNSIFIDPHKDIVSFRFLVDDDSIRSYYFNKTNLRIDLFGYKIRRLVKNIYEKLGIIWVE